MVTTQLAPPYPIFTDKNGDPLDAGFLYFGTANLNPETNPIQVYYDSALTQPAAQPLRTTNGYIMRNGSPALIYANAQFSVTVRNKKSELVIYSPVGYGILPGTSETGTDQVTYNEGSTGAVSRTLTSRLQDYVSVKDFGAVGNGVSDDSLAIQAAIDSVSVDSGAVFFPDGTYVHASLINIPAGVRLVGDSRGEKILGGITKGSILKYTGSASGIYINGSMAGIENIALVGTALCTGVGLQLNGDVNVVESWVLKDVSFFGYTAGTALKLVGINTGYVAYGYAESLRFRNCLIGIHIFSTGGGSGFVNTNQFYGGGIAGGSTVNYCIWVQGGNDNRFLGMSVEPASSTVGHIVVETGWINFDGRIEGASQPLNIPLVKFSSGTQTSTIAGLGGDGLIIDPTRKNEITINGSKSPKPKYSSSNLFSNATFSGVSTSAIPGWTVTGAGVTFTSADSTFLEYCNTITVTVPAGVLATIRQNLNTTIFDGASFSMGVYVKTASTEQISFSMTDGVSTSTGQPYLNDNTLQFMGHRKTAASSPTTLRAQVNLNNTAGLSAMVVELTMPMIVVGTDLPYPSSRVLNADYAVMNGLFSTSFGDTTVAISEIVLPRNGNSFVISGGTAITRVNQGATDRFPVGTEITLFADVGANLALTDGTYLLLNGSFAAAKQWDNITLVHIGNGIWVEKCRVTH